jgi:hypothetical protein
MGPGQPLEHISVFNVKHLLDEARAYAERRTSGAAAPQLSVVPAPTTGTNETQTVDDITV